MESEGEYISACIYARKKKKKKKKGEEKQKNCEEEEGCWLWIIFHNETVE